MTDTDPWATMQRQLNAHSHAPTRTYAVPPQTLGTIAITGSFRVYFHRLNPDGLPWCVSPDGGGWEIAVREVTINAPATAVHRPKATPDDEDGKPSAWIAVSGTLRVGPDGHASIEAAP